MTLLCFEGFDIGDQALVYGGSSTTAAGRFGGRALQLSTTNTIFPIASASEVWFGFAYQTMNTGNVQIRLYGDSGATLHVQINISDSQTYEVRRGGTTLATIPNVHPTSATDWHHLRVRCVLSDTTGVIELYKDGDPSPFYSFSGDTRNAGTVAAFDQLRINNSTGGAGSGKVDDLWITDTVGSAPYNGDLGELVVTTLLPNGNGNSSQLVGSDGNSTDNYLLVDEGGPYSTADYVGSATVGQKDTYTLTDLPAGVATVLAVQEVGVALKSDAGAANGQTVLRSGSTDYDGTSTALATTATSVRGSLRTTNPATSAAWTPSEPDSIEAGFKVA